MIAQKGLCRIKPDKTSTRLADGNLTREAGRANALGERI
jgi:hypothetical protein